MPAALSATDTVHSTNVANKSSKYVQMYKVIVSQGKPAHSAVGFKKQTCERPSKKNVHIISNDITLLELSWPIVVFIILDSPFRRHFMCAEQTKENCTKRYVI